MAAPADHHRGAQLRQPGGYGSSDAAPAASDNSHLSGQILAVVHYALLLLSSLDGRAIGGAGASSAALKVGSRPRNSGGATLPVLLWFRVEALLAMSA